MHCAKKKWATLAESPIVAYKYGYGLQYPTAEILNAKSVNVFYSSFEEDGQLDVNAKTGIKSHSGNFIFNPPSDYVFVNGSILSYWEWVDTDWKYHEQSYNGGSVTLSGLKIDEVRIHPAVAKMTTYTYRPHIGITSACDPNNRITFFEYDDLGRLLFKKDDGHNVIEHYTYRYKVQK